MKACREIREEFMETPVPAEGKETVAACSECAEVWKGLEKTIAALGAWGAAEPASLFDTCCRAQLNEVKARETQASGWFAWLRGPMWRPVTAGALAVVMAIGITVLYRQPASPVRDASNVQAVKGTAVADLKGM